MFKYRNHTIVTLSILVLLTFVSCESSRKREFVVDGYLIELDSLVEKHRYIDSVISIYRVEVDKEMGQILAHSEHVMERGTPEGLLNNFVADLVLEIGKELYKPEDGKPIDFCLLNYGGLRTSIPKGAVSKSRIFELLPFENEMIVVTISGEKTIELFNYLADYQYGMPVSGIKLGISDKKPQEILINNEAFNDKRDYKVLTSDYLANGGDNMSFFLQPKNSELIGKRVRDAIILHLERANSRGEKISSKLDQRMYYIK
ncbi:MAG: 5'-nucleotidase C-terminal domain-containing protein [Bacteroidetes bacterium]|nr:5'-nucleotidase C-terminal domain-containing protein [Bacteroidota bacterium]